MIHFIKICTPITKTEFDHVATDLKLIRNCQERLKMFRKSKDIFFLSNFISEMKLVVREAEHRQKQMERPKRINKTSS